MTIQTNPERWKQRFQNYEKAILLLENRIEDLNSLDENSKYYEGIMMSLIQAFEISFELAWKVMKDYLEYEGYQDAKSPRSVIRTAFQAELIDDGEVWLDSIDKRNLTTHTYDKVAIEQTAGFVKNVFYPICKNLSEKLKAKL